jgi:purine-nucleoside/S-methyl-5'-thioadenosine phosphorylase / adenosine deaminase
MTALFQQPFRSLAGLPVIAFVTTRHGGVSSPPFDTLNLAYLTADDRSAVRQNRERLAAALEVGHDDLLIGRQVHGARVNSAEDIVLGETEGDAIVLTRPGTVAMLVVADCLPLICYDPATHVGAIAHAGWRGLAAGLLQGVVEALLGNGARTEDIRVGIGPAIRRCCYEVGPEVVSAVDAQESERRPGSGDRVFLDLAAVAFRQLHSAGVTARQVEDVGVCTRCESDVYFSARAGEPTGRFAAGLKLLQPADIIR